MSTAPITGRICCVRAVLIRTTLIPGLEPEQTGEEQFDLLEVQLANDQRAGNPAKKQLQNHGARSRVEIGMGRFD